MYGLHWVKSAYFLSLGQCLVNKDIRSCLNHFSFPEAQLVVGRGGEVELADCLHDGDTSRSLRARGSERERELIKDGVVLPFSTCLC